MKRKIKLEELIVKENNQKRLDSYVTDKLSKVSRTTAQRLIEEEKILVNGKKQKASYKPEEGDVISIEIPEAKDVELKAQDIPVPVVYEDNDIIVVNKPKGMVVHPANGNPDGTLVNAILAMCKDSLSGIGGEIRPGIVHRLDKDTSGLLIVAKNDEAHMNMSKQIQERKVTKKYIALVRGVVAEDEATIDLPIARSTKDRKKMAVVFGGREAVTHFNVLERFGQYTLVECILETGRTHQIRVHMASIGHSIVGDPLYGIKKEKFNLNGQLLHAKTIGFVHPRTGKMMEFTSDIPEYFENVLEKLRKR